MGCPGLTYGWPSASSGTVTADNDNDQAGVEQGARLKEFPTMND